MQKYQTKKDLLLMSYFRNNARENLTKISRMTSIPVSTIFDRLKEFERSLIKKHTSIIDFKKIGFDIRMNIMFKLPKESREEFRDFIMKNENVNSLFRVNNGYDFMIEAIFKDMNDLHRFMESVERFNVDAKQELFILEDLKREGFLSDKLHAELLYSD
jgi:DNA-binding Lrp family transcriptional regulator